MDSEAYGTKLFGYIGAGCAAISIAMATETGIMEVLLSSKKPMTSKEIADEKNLKESYVRELLGALVTSEVIWVDRESILYHVPAHYTAVLRATAEMCRFIPCYGQRFPVVKECFPRTGPSGICELTSTRVTELLESYHTANRDRHLDEEILAVVPGLEEKLDEGIKVAEFGCGFGHILNKMAGRFPASTFYGSDVDEESITIARKEADDKKLANIMFEVIDIYKIPDEICEVYDWVYIEDVIHDLSFPGKAMLGVQRTIKPGGLFSMVGMCVHDSLSVAAGNLNACFLYTTSMLNCLLAESSHPQVKSMGGSWTRKTAHRYLERTGFNVIKMQRNKLEDNIFHFVCEV